MDSDQKSLDKSFKVNNFDLLRIAAATQVVLIHSIAHFHIPHPSWWWLINAFPGVPIFFAISGFLISASFERSSTIRTYYGNRFLRIYPGLWCCVLLTVLVASMCGYSFLNVHAFLWLVAQLTGFIYTPGFLHKFGFGSYNGALWTIPIELQFYIVLPFLYAATSRLRRRTAVLSCAFAIFLVIAYGYARVKIPLAESVEEPIGQKLFRYSFLPHIYMFLMGVLLQRWKVHRSSLIAGKGIVWIAGYIIAYLLLPTNTLGYVLETVLLAFVVVSVAYTVPNCAKLLLRGNDISYGVYIYHGLVINVLLETGHSGSWGWLLLTVVLAYAIGFVSWKIVERPALRRKKNAMHPPMVDIPIPIVADELRYAQPPS